MGIDEVRRRILKERQLPARLGHLARAASPPPSPRPATSPPACRRTIGPTPMGWGTNVVIRKSDPYGRWDDANVVRGNAKGTVSAYAYCRLGDVTAEQFRAVAAIQRDLGAGGAGHQPAELRVPRPHRGAAARPVRAASAFYGMAEPGAELARDVVACPGADTCNLAVTQSRGLADEIGRALEEAGLAEVGGVRVNISGCTNSCGQHHISDIGFMGVERRAHGQAAPGYQMLLGGYVGAHPDRVRPQGPAPAGQDGRPRPPCGSSAGSPTSARPARASPPGSSGSAAPRRWPTAWPTSTSSPTPTDNPDFYVDYGETGPYIAEVGAGECAAG